MREKLTDEEIIKLLSEPGYYVKYQECIRSINKKHSTKPPQSLSKDENFALKLNMQGLDAVKLVVSKLKEIDEVLKKVPERSRENEQESTLKLLKQQGYEEASINQAIDTIAKIKLEDYNTACRKFLHNCYNEESLKKIDIEDKLENKYEALKTFFDKIKGSNFECDEELVTYFSNINNSMSRIKSPSDQDDHRSRSVVDEIKYKLQSSKGIEKIFTRVQNSAALDKFNNTEALDDNSGEILCTYAKDENASYSRLSDVLFIGDDSYTNMLKLLGIEVSYVNSVLSELRKVIFESVDHLEEKRANHDSIVGMIVDDENLIDDDEETKESFDEFIRNKKHPKILCGHLVSLIKGQLSQQISTLTADYVPLLSTNARDQLKSEDTKYQIGEALWRGISSQLQTDSHSPLRKNDLNDGKISKSKREFLTQACSHLFGTRSPAPELNFITVECDGDMSDQELFEMMNQLCDDHITHPDYVYDLSQVLKYNVNNDLLTKMLESTALPSVSIKFQGSVPGSEFNPTFDTEAPSFEQFNELHENLEKIKSKSNGLIFAASSDGKYYYLESKDDGNNVKLFGSFRKKKNFNDCQKLLTDLARMSERNFHPKIHDKVSRLLNDYQYKTMQRVNARPTLEMISPDWKDAKLAMRLLDSLQEKFNLERCNPDCIESLRNYAQNTRYKRSYHKIPIGKHHYKRAQALLNVLANTKVTVEEKKKIIDDQINRFKSNYEDENVRSFEKPDAINQVDWDRLVVKQPKSKKVKGTYVKCLEDCLKYYENLHTTLQNRRRKYSEVSVSTMGNGPATWNKNSP